VKRVLVVDDDDAIRESLEMALERRYEVVTAPNGRAALEALERQPVDVVLLDLMMPVLDGAGFMAEARRRGHGVPVVVMSAGTQVRERSQQMGAFDYLQKPISMDVLEEKLARALANGAAGA
jgi:DNA-binding NtrC family response regulator